MNWLAPLTTMVGFFAFSVKAYVGGVSSPQSRAYAVDAFREHTLRALFPILALGCMVGAMFALQAYLLINTFDIERYLPSVSAHVILNEVGPIFTGLMLSMQAGAYLSAEIASMRYQHEIDAIHVMGIHPFKLVFGPKLVGLSLAAPLLNLVTLFWATLGTILVASVYYSYPFHEFAQRFLSNVSIFTLVFGQFKTFIFGFLIGSMSIYWGYNSNGKTSQLGSVASRAVVGSISVVFTCNYFLNWLVL